MCVYCTVLYCREMNRPSLLRHPLPPCPLCLQALLALACLSIFVTSLKFDVSFFLLTASEPCMNELVIYTKCLIKSAAAPGIHIVERLGIFAVKGARDCSKTHMCLRYEVKPGSFVVSWSVTLAHPHKHNMHFVCPFIYSRILSVWCLVQGVAPPLAGSIPSLCLFA